MNYKPEHIMTFGKNKGFSLKEIYQYNPTYLEYLVKYGLNFKIDINDFQNLPHPTIADPEKLPPQEGQRLRFYPPIKLETSVKVIKEYINNGGKFQKLNYTFPNKIVEILDLKRKGEYIVPNYDERNNI